MFDLFSWSHILILLVVALVVVGPKDLPRLMHMVGRWVGKARNMAGEFKRSFDDMAREAELDQLRKEIDALKTINPISDIQNALNETAASGPLLPPDEPAVTETAIDTGPEPRSGEFAVTETQPTPPADKPPTDQSTDKSLAEAAAAPPSS